MFENVPGIIAGICSEFDPEGAAQGRFTVGVWFFDSDFREESSPFIVFVEEELPESLGLFRVVFGDALLSFLVHRIVPLHTSVNMTIFLPFFIKSCLIATFRFPLVNEADILTIHVSLDLVESEDGNDLVARDPHSSVATVIEFDPSVVAYSLDDTDE